MTVWKSPPRALHSFSITASISQDQLQWSVLTPPVASAAQGSQNFPKTPNKEDQASNENVYCEKTEKNQFLPQSGVCKNTVQSCSGAALKINRSCLEKKRNLNPIFPSTTPRLYPWLDWEFNLYQADNEWI